MEGVLFGVDYYPEFVSKDMWEKDIKRMRDMGIEAVRMMEFAWVLLEPQENCYDFSLFDEVINILAKYNMKAVLGTPTATFPIWLYEKDKSILQVSPLGGQRDFGSRRDGCFNNETYREYAKKIVDKIGEHYGKNEIVIGWQIDNEVGHEGSDRCVCDNCKKKWHIWLKNKYKTIDELNKSWGTVFWGTKYSDFSQIPVARKQFTTGLNPTMVLDYDRFSSDSAIEFVNMQIEILRKHKSQSQWISTNLYPVPHGIVIDMEKMFKNMDFPAFDNYPVWGDMKEPHIPASNSYFLTYIRGLKDIGLFTIFEQMTGMQAHSCLGYLPHEKQLTLWVNQAIARGANKIFYFSWRTPAFAQEQICYGLIDGDEKETDRKKEIEDNMKRNRIHYERFANIPYEAEICLAYDKDNSRVYREQYLSKGAFLQPNNYLQIGYDVELIKNFAPYVIFNLNVDIRSVDFLKDNMDRYKLISLPMYQLTDVEFCNKLKDWVKKGGNLILGWRTGVRDKNNHNLPLTLPGYFAEMAGIEINKFESLNEDFVKLRMGILPLKGRVWADIITPKEAKPFIFYNDKRKHYNHKVAATANNYGNGKVYYLGTSLDPASIYFVYKKILKECGFKPEFYGTDIEIIKRKTIDGKIAEIILNHSKRDRTIKGVKVKGYDMAIKYE